jgi:hypothetical protein
MPVNIQGGYRPKHQPLNGIPDPVIPGIGYDRDFGAVAEPKPAVLSEPLPDDLSIPDFLRRQS